MSLRKWFLLVVVFCIQGSALAAEPQFVIEDVNRSANGNRQIGLKLSSDGRVHVAYTGCSDAKCNKDELFYSVRGTNGKWASGVVDGDKGATGWFVTLLFDEPDLVRLFYSHHYDKPVLRQAWRARGGEIAPDQGWRTEVVGKITGGYWTSAVATPEAIYVANTVFPKNNVLIPAFQIATYARDRQQWSFEQLDEAPDTGWFTSMATGPDGLPVVTYLKNGYSKGDLRVARKLPTGEWEYQTIDDEAVKSSVAVDAKGFVHVAYTKMDPEFMTTRDLMYATNAPDGQWKHTRLDGGQHEKQDTGLFPHLKIDARGGLHIVFNDNYHAKVVYARNLGDGWKLYPVTKNHQDGYYAWMELDDKGGLHFAYDAGFVLRYVYCADCGSAR